ncbi:MAG: VWA domain-containing protein [Thermoanaerobaculia bacterium]
MKTSTRAALAAALTLLLPVATAYPQNEAFSESIEVQQVLVDVVVQDRSGDPILNLEAADFQIFEDGKPVALTGFTPPSGIRSLETRGARPLDPLPGEALSETPARTVVFIDALFLKPHNRKKVLKQVKRTLLADLQPNEEVMLVRWDGNLRMIQDFTRDRRVIADAFESEIASKDFPAMAAMNDTDKIIGLLDQRFFTETTGRRTSGDPCVDSGMIARGHARSVHHRVMNSVAGLYEAVSTLASYEGRKALLHVSDGIPLVPGADAFLYAASLCDGTNQRTSTGPGVDTSYFGSGKRTRWDPTTARSEMNEYDTTKDWSRVADHANAYRIALYTLKATGLTGTRSSSLSGENSRVFHAVEFEMNAGDRDALALLSARTGGRAVLDTNRFDLAFEQMRSDYRNSYLLAYDPPEAEHNRLREIRVEVDRPGARLLHRTGYRSKPQAERIADGLLSTIRLGTGDNELGVALLAGEEGEATPGFRSLKIVVPLSELTLVPDEHRQRALFSVYVMSANKAGATTRVRYKVIPVDVDDPDRDFTYEVLIPALSQPQSFAVAVRDELGGETAFVRTGHESG